MEYHKMVMTSADALSYKKARPNSLFKFLCGQGDDRETACLKFIFL